MGRLDGRDILTAFSRIRAKENGGPAKEPPFLLDLEADETAGRST